MKTKLFLLLFIVYSNCVSAQYIHTEIYLKDSTKVTCKRYRFKKSKNLIVYRDSIRKKHKISILDIDRISIVYQKSDNPKYYYPDKIYKFKLINGSYIMVQQIILGKINLYRTEEIVNFGENWVDTLIKYYLEKNDSNDELIFFVSNGIFGNRRFKLVANSVFKSCPELLKKINNKEFTRKNIEEIVTFYNNCK